jgi:hypothetical protein
VPADRLHKALLLHRLPRDVEEEEGDEADEESARVLQLEEHVRRERQEQAGDDLTCATGDRRRPRAVAGEAPDRRAEHAAAVERESGKQIEDRDLQVHLPEHLRDRDRGQEPRRPQQRVRQLSRSAERSARDHEARRRPGDRHEELTLRARRLLREGGDSAEQEQGDRRHRQAEASRDDRVRELVRDDRREEQERGDRTRDERLRLGCREHRRELLLREAIREVEEDQEPREMHPHVDPEEACDTERARHTPSIAAILEREMNA